MTQLGLNSAVASALQKAEDELRAILLAAAREVKKDGSDLVLHLEDDMKGLVNGFKGIVAIEGQHVGNVLHLLSFLKAIEPHVAGDVKSVEVDMEKVVTPVQEVVKDVAEIPEAIKDLNHME